MSKNRVIFILVVLIFIGGIWGSRADRKRIMLEKELKETISRLEDIQEQAGRQQEQVLGKTVGLQETLAEKEELLDKARKELVSLRKEVKTIEAQLSACNATVQKLKQEKSVPDTEKDRVQQKGTNEDALHASSPDEAADSVSLPDKDATAEKAGSDDVMNLRVQLEDAELTIDRLRRKYDAANAQLIGMEKLLEEKNAAMEETSLEMDRLEINMDVLLSKIADQRDALQEIRAENRDLVKELAARNEEIGDLEEQVMRQPVLE